MEVAQKQTENEKISQILCKYCIHVICHTHWDREWYLPFSIFNIHLAELTNHLIEAMEADKEFRFDFDGQTVIIEDYLNNYPENYERLKTLVQEGRLSVGPLYVQNDESLVSGESQIRNFLIGTQSARKLFSKCASIGYFPDQWGHFSQLPQILRGFSIDTVVLMRGIKPHSNGEWDDLFEWQAPNGSRVLLINCNYGNGVILKGESNRVKYYKLPETQEELSEKVEQLTKDQLSKNDFMLMYGVDHIFPNNNLGKLINTFNHNSISTKLIRSSLEDYIHKIKKQLSTLKHVHGELRRGPFLHPGTLATRIYLKQANFHNQDMLEKWAEPFHVFSYCLGEKYQHKWLTQAWKLLLQNQAHDSICGCSIDDVHQDMIYRFRNSSQIASHISNISLQSICKRIDTTEINNTEKMLCVFNPLNWHRSDPLEAEVAFPAEWKIKSIEILDGKTRRPIPCRIDNNLRDYALDLDPNHSPIVKKLNKFKIAISPHNVPACGYKNYLIRPSIIAGKTHNQPKYTTSLENKYLEIEINTNGSLNITDKITRKRYDNLNTFIDYGEAGDEYDYARTTNDVPRSTHNSIARIKYLHDDDMGKVFEIGHELELPDAIYKNTNKRSENIISNKIVSRITLYPDSPVLHIHTIIENNVRDHCLCVEFPSDIHADHCNVESQFDIIQRPLRHTLDIADVETSPQGSFLDISNKEYGLALFNKGLPAYRATAEGKVQLLLLRCVGWLGKFDLSSRTTAILGYPLKTPDAQCLGTHEFDYAIFPHAGDLSLCDIQRKSHEFKVPMQTQQISKHSGTLPAISLSFINVSNDCLFISAIKKHEINNSLVIRIYNPTSTEQDTTITSYWPIESVKRINMDESPQADLYSNNGFEQHLRFDPKEIITLELHFK